MSETNRTLWDIGDDLHALNDLLEEIGGEVTEASAEEAIDAFFAELGEEEETKIDNYCALYRHRLMLAKARDEEAARLSALATTDKNVADRLKSRLKLYLESQGKTKFESVRSKVAISNNGGALPIIIDEEYKEHPDELPEGYRRVKYEPDLKKIGEDLNILEGMRQKVEGMRPMYEAARDRFKSLEADLKADPTNTELKAEAGKALDVWNEAAPEFENAEKAYQDAVADLNFARYGIRGNHLRIK